MRAVLLTSVVGWATIMIIAGSALRGMVALMEPGGRPSLGQVSSCQCTMVGPGPCAVCFPSRRTCHWPCQWRVLVVCYYHKREVALGA